MTKFERFCRSTKILFNTKMYPDREPNFDYLPKTLIFAESDIHASLIVEVAKEVFGREDDRFVQKNHVLRRRLC